MVAILIPSNLYRFCHLVRSAGGRALLVGGCVRDAVMGGSPKDFDVEVYGLTLGEVQSLLVSVADGGRVDAVGVSFGVLKARFNGEEIDISLPRLDSKRGEGHKGFVVEMKSDLTVEQAASRRDFTMNAMGYDPLTGELVDPFDGRMDIKLGYLVPTSKAFCEDSLRVLRGMQFAGRFDMKASIPMRELALGMVDDYHSLPAERVWGEWEKWATKSVCPSKGIETLYLCGWDVHYPEIFNLRSCLQDKEWHPEGNAYVHTLHVCDAMARLCEADRITGEDRCVLMFAALCHDFGKASCTALVDGRWRSPGHASASVPLAENFLKRIGCFQRIIDRVLPLIEEHMAHIGLDVNKRTVRRLANRIAPATIRELAYVVHADMAGRPPLPAEQNEKMLEILQYAESENVAEEKVQPLVMGRDLLLIGYVAGPEMGRVLKYLYEKQLDGEFSTKEEGIELLNQAIED
jgi:tRNA nucleotidyltransferase (CCA-adding enzyme)